MNKRVYVIETSSPQKKFKDIYGQQTNSAYTQYQTLRLKKAVNKANKTP